MAPLCSYVCMLQVVAVCSVLTQLVPMNEKSTELEGLAAQSFSLSWTIRSVNSLKLGSASLWFVATDPIKNKSALPQEMA